MATYTKREVVSKTIEYSVPCTYHGGAFIAEIAKAMIGIEHDAKQLGIKTDCDDWCLVIPRDEDIIFVIKVP